jgi:putative NIF3 family GTP cyclohydrolase 1 type 2
LIKKVIQILLTCAVLSQAQPIQTKAQAPTAREIIEQIKSRVGVHWRSETVDTFKAGNPDAPVTGIAVTMMATFDVLRRAAASRKNLVITHEPTFFNHQDQTADFEKEHDPVWAEKEAFIKEHNLIVWRFHDHWHLREPDGILTGMVRALGWQTFQSPGNPGVFALPETTLDALARDIKKRLGIHVLRVVGDPHLKVTQVGLKPGASGFAAHRQMLQRNDVQVLVIGEAQEWETVEYAADAATEGRQKALIILGHIPSEQAGMEDCAVWLRTFITSVPVEFVPASEPFWMP